ncbi:MAG: putative porin [Bacteroidota bacterium]
MAKKITYLFLTFFLLCSLASVAQLPGKLRNIAGGFKGSASGKPDSLKHRDKLEDSITISFRYIDSSRNYKLDSTISDFTRKFPIPATNLYLGNDGSPSESLLFTPIMKSGFDPGFHAFDIYKWKPEKMRFLNTTRPYSELNYLIGSKAEQIIEVFHTQNIRPNWNVSFNYRMLNAPGYFLNQKVNHNNYLLTSWYQGKKKRYNNYIMILSNNLQAGENGGFISDDREILDVPEYKDRITIPTKIGSNETYSTNFFNTTVTTGNRYKELTMLMRQQYDFGKKDSIVTDSTVVPLFYPRLRLEHTFSYNKYSYQFVDASVDTAYYNYYYDSLRLDGSQSSISIRDKWNDIQNDFSIYQFPDAKNLQQFIKLGAAIQNLNGTFDSAAPRTLYNLVGHAEYRNRTRNRKWEIEANGKLYLNGYNSGDYEVHGSLQRLIGRKLGYLQLGFENVNRSPSFLYNTSSSFYFDDTTKNFNKENTTHFFASYFNPLLKMKLSGDYFVVSNYMYVTSFYKLQQQSALFTFIRVSMEKTFRIGKHWNWYTDIYVQQKAGDVNLNVPLIFTRNRLALEGVYYKNLNISTGIEVRYNTPYKADGYSPVLGQFMYQDTTTIKNRPDIRLFLNFRIKSFRLFFSAANLNSISFSNGFGWTANNVPSPGYAYPGLQLRFGIYWSFVN